MARATVVLPEPDPPTTPMRRGRCRMRREACAGPRRVGKRSTDGPSRASSPILTRRAGSLPPRTAAQSPYFPPPGDAWERRDPRTAGFDPARPRRRRSTSRCRTRPLCRPTAAARHPERTVPGHPRARERLGPQRPDPPPRLPRGRVGRHPPGGRDLQRRQELPLHRRRPGVRPRPDPRCRTSRCGSWCRTAASTATTTAPSPGTSC